MFNVVRRLKLLCGASKYIFFKKDLVKVTVGRQNSKSASRQKKKNNIPNVTKIKAKWPRT